MGFSRLSSSLVDAFLSISARKKFSKNIMSISSEPTVLVVLLSSEQVHRAVFHPIAIWRASHLGQRHLLLAHVRNHPPSRHPPYLLTQPHHLRKSAGAPRSSKTWHLQICSSHGIEMPKAKAADRSLKVDLERCTDNNSSPFLRYRFRYRISPLHFFPPINMYTTNCIHK